MKEKILHIVDTYSTCSYHEFFNAGFLVSCCQVADKVIYHAAQSSQKCVMSLLEKKGYKGFVPNIECRSLCVVHKESTWRSLLRTFVSAFLNVYYLFVGGKGPVIFMHNDAFSIYWLNLFNFFLRRPIWIVCHGELELLISSPRWCKPSFLYKHLFHFFFKHINIGQKMHFIVLGHSIASNLKHIVSEKNEKRFVAVEHPYFFEAGFTTKHVIQGQMFLGTVGVLNEFKGFYRLQNLVELLREKIEEGRLSVSVIGRLENVIPVHQDLIQYSTLGNSLLPREKFSQLICGLDYVLFLYNTESYKLIASGAIFDAISFGKPIIALRNDYFVAVFERCGEIGYLCSSLDEIFQLVVKLIDNPDMVTYDYFLMNMKKARVMFAPEQVKIDLFE